MKHPDALSLAFIDRKPRAAARAINGLAVVDAAAFLDSIPARYAKQVLAEIGLVPAARILAGMETTSAAAALREMPYLDAVSILRLAGSGEHERLMGQLPRRLRRDFEATLAFPADTVGAWMTTELVALEQTHTVSDAGAALREAADLPTDVLFITNTRRVVRGVVTPAQLFRFDGDTPLEQIMDRSVVPLSARQTLSSASSSEAWEQYHWLPVTGRRKNLIGALSGKDLVGRREVDTRAPISGGGLLTSVATEFAACAMGLVGLLTDPEHNDSRGELP